jgi:hypothetical protein
MKLFFKLMFIFCTLGVGLIFWPWLFPKLDDKVKEYRVDGVMINMWVGKKAATKALDQCGMVMCNHDERMFIQGKYGNLGSQTVTARAFRIIAVSPVFSTQDAQYRTPDSHHWKHF